ncbi:hypothetical protein BDD12DRAFT_805662 [Trichophaea hybrida]|nr:hypothetical protein BDD12DRAFT_805662 [Trichophaea hybrida]
MVSFFWNTALLQAEGAVSPQDLPDRLAGRNASWCIESEIYPQQRALLKWNIIPSSTTPCDPIRVGVRVTCQDGLMSTTLGCFMYDTLMQSIDSALQCTDSPVVATCSTLQRKYHRSHRRTISIGDLALVEPAEGVRFDPRDYFEDKPTLRLLKSHEFKVESWVMSDGYTSGPLARLVARFDVISTTITLKGGCNLECLSGWDMNSW